MKVLGVCWLTSSPKLSQHLSMLDLSLMSWSASAFIVSKTFMLNVLLARLVKEDIAILILRLIIAWSPSSPSSPILLGLAS